MRITQVRNATVLVEMGARRVLVDPMLSPAGVMPGFRLFRGERRKNPLVELPEGWEEVFARATEVLITHEHPDHLDPPAVEWIRSRGLTVWGSRVDVPNLRRKGLDARVATEMGTDVAVEIVPGVHGHGVVGWLLGPVAGFYLAVADEPSLYVTGDTVLTARVREAVERLRPEVIIAPAGAANFGMGKDILFSEAELVELAQLSAGRLAFNHLEAIDHCLVTRTRLRELMDGAGVGERVSIPEDGEAMEFAREGEAVEVAVKAPVEMKPGFQKWLTAKFAGT